MSLVTGIFNQILMVAILTSHNKISNPDRAVVDITKEYQAPMMDQNTHGVFDYVLKIYEHTFSYY